MTRSRPQNTCPGCEGTPAVENDPCAVCGTASGSFEALARTALVAARTALNDWLHTHASELCDETAVAASAARVGEVGTLAYIAGVQQRINAALGEGAPPEPDMRAVCDALGFDPTNHHNAAVCPYCNPTHGKPTS